MFAAFGARTFSTSKCVKQTKMRHAFCHHISKLIRKRQVGHGHAHHCKTTIVFILDLLSVARVHLSDWVRCGNPTPLFYALLPKHAIPGPGESSITRLLSSLPATWTSTLHRHRNFHPCTIPSHSLTAPTHALIAFALTAASRNPWRPSAIWTWTLHFVMFCLISPQHVGLAHQHIEQNCLQSTQFRRLWQQHPYKKPNSIFLVLSYCCNQYGFDMFDIRYHFKIMNLIRFEFGAMISMRLRYVFELVWVCLGFGSAIVWDVNFDLVLI